MSVLEVRDLSVTFTTPSGVARAVDEVAFSLDAGETLALVGESGSGKTMTALAVLGLVPPPGRVGSSSQVRYQDRNLLGGSEAAWRAVRGAEIAIVFQEPTTSLNPVLTIGTQITETIHAHERVTKAAARARAAELLQRVGIADPTHRLDSYPHQLSGGMRQRAMIAMALACRPTVLIADEPTTALDVTVQAQILELLAALKAELGMAMLLITHNLGLAAGVADRVAVMYGGRLVESADTDALFHQPVHPYTAGLLRAAPRLEGPARPQTVIPGAVPPATAWPTGCRFHPRCAFAWERCAADEPPTLSPAPGRTARCWLVEEPDRRRA